MEKIKRRDPLPKIKNFLEHLESNLDNPKKRTYELLVKSFPSEDNLNRLMDLCEKKAYIKPDGIGEDDRKSYGITLDGLEYLDRLRIRGLELQNYNIQKLLVSATIILALSASYNIIEKLSEGAIKAALEVVVILGILSLTLYILYKYFFKGMKY